MYKLIRDTETNEINTVRFGNAFIPFAVDNTDYAKFKTDIAEGVTLLDAEGVEMTPEQVQALLETLP
jgi:hypothetical protein